MFHLHELHGDAERRERRRIIRSDEAKREIERARSQKRSSRKLNSRRLAELTDTIASIMRTGTPTFFEYENACRTGVRRSLIWEGWRWLDADTCALEVTNRALSQIGAIRPKLADSQPDTLRRTHLHRYYCESCGNLLKAVDRGKRRFCSKLCSNQEGKVRAKLDDRAVSQAEYLAECALKRQQKIEESRGNCETCGDAFLGSRPGTRFCSQACHAKSRQIHQPRDCPECGMTFKPVQRGKNEFQQYCSMACAAKNRTGTRERAPRPELTCKGCGSIFFAPYPSIVRHFCSVSCSSRRPRHLGKISCEEA